MIQLYPPPSHPPHATTQHFLYKVCRAVDPTALHNEFRRDTEHEARSFEQVQNEALCNVENFMSLTDDVNTQFKDSKDVKAYQYDMTRHAEQCLHRYNGFS